MQTVRGLDLVVLAVNEYLHRVQEGIPLGIGSKGSLGKFLRNILERKILKIRRRFLMLRRDLVRQLVEGVFNKLRGKIGVSDLAVNLFVSHTGDDVGHRLPAQLLAVFLCVTVDGDFILQDIIEAGQIQFLFDKVQLGCFGMAGRNIPDGDAGRTEGFFNTFKHGFSSLTQTNGGLDVRAAVGDLDPFLPAFAAVAAAGVLHGAGDHGDGLQ